jgi:sec-independent protein translocase protein TatC
MPKLSVPGRKRRANPEGRMSVLDHLRELRRRVIIVLIIVGVGAFVGWFLYDPILDFLKHPYCNVPYKYRAGGSPDGDCKLAYFEPLGGFTTHLKASVITGSIITAPLWLYQLWAFVTPGLRRNERKWTVIFVVASTTLFVAGMTLAYLILLKGFTPLIEAGGEGTQAFLTVNAYLSFVILMAVAFGASFELPLLIILLNTVRVLPYRFLRKWQRLSIFLIFCFAGIATPTADPFTMCAMAIPMVLLFELSVLYCYFHDRRRAREKQAAREPDPDDDVPSQINPIPENLPDADPTDIP